MHKRNESEAPQERLALSVEDTADALSVGRVTIFKLIKEGRLKASKIGRRTIITMAEVQSFLASLPKAG
jgi:excisionase family DNA binding protein